MQKENIQRPYKGLSQDNSLGDQPKDTYRFTLNSVNETELGDFAFISNEESNEICVDLKGLIPLGKVYITDGEQLLFLVAPDESFSEIGILHDNCTYTALVNDANSPEDFKLNFKVQYQIDATYRLRKGCERTIYFTDDFNKPRVINIDSLEDYKTAGEWNSRLFNLFRDYNNIPKFQKIEVLDSGGQVLPGSYNIAIQYLDESLNPTEWITVSPTINIYNDLSTEDYNQIDGSINGEADFLKFGKTSKSIKVNLDNLDNVFLYYRLAFISANNGSGLVNTVEVSEVIPITKKFYIYTGNNAVTTGTEEEIKAFSEVIYRAKHIEQIENSLLLANTQGKQVEFCRLQKYVSRIKADCVLKDVNLSSVIDPSNPKNPTMSLGGVGYMPGEIYSFGIVYVFKDGTLSPTYHIPGKSPDVSNEHVYVPGPNVVPMSNVDNQSDNTLYHDNDTCSTNEYWGLDSEGVSLKDKKVRHHRFPLRSEIETPLFEVTDEGETQELTYYNIQLSIYGDLITPIPCDTDIDPNCVTPEGNYFEIRIKYTVGGQIFYFTTSVDADTYSDGTGSYIISLNNVSEYHSTDNIEITNIQVSTGNGIFEDLCTSCEDYTWVGSGYFNGDATINTEVLPYSQTTQSRNYKTKILGIQFSGIDIPSAEDINGEEIIGYYIVRNERTEFEKTIIDSAVLIPTMKNKKYVSQGLLFPEYSEDNDGSNKVGITEPTVWGMIHPEHKFNKKEYVVYDEMIQEGSYNLKERKYGKVTVQDVLDGTTYDEEIHKDNSQEDEDGWDLDIISRDNIVDFEAKSTFVKRSKDGDFENRFYLSALESRSIQDNSIDVYNIAADNKIGIIEFSDKEKIEFDDELPYVILKKYNTDPYSNFRVLPYYKDSINMEEFTSDRDNRVQIFGGDSYVSPLRYVNTMFWDNRIAIRKGKTSVWKYILGALLIAVGVVLAIFSGGTSSVLVVLGVGIMAASAGVLFVSSGIKADNMYRAYADEWRKGLRETTLDAWVKTFYQYTWQPSTGSGYTEQGSMWNYFPTAPTRIYNNHSVVVESPYYGDYAPPHGDKSNWGQDGPSDDTIQWVGEAVTDLWFESSVNIALRHRMITELPTFLEAPGRIESGNNSRIALWEYFKIMWTSSETRPAVSALERHLIKKMLVFNGEREGSRELIGVPFGEYYEVNPDYHRYNKQKIYFHLPLEYDCCSDCLEDFPHRVHYSEQSFQEELSDNYRIFLPNNYRDLDGETGEITNLFKLSNRLFVHTEEALWQLQNARRERVSDGIVTYIGTGSFFDIPPQKIVDGDNGNSAGLQHKWASLKTPHGYFFVSENQAKVYQFDSQLKPISNLGLNNWLKENIEISLDNQYKETSGYDYEYSDNPSNKFGTGFILTYDGKKERILISKKDFIFNEEIESKEDYKLVSFNNDLTLFEDFESIINYENSQGWNYEGIYQNKLKFSKDVIVNDEIEARPGDPPYLETQVKFVEGLDISNAVSANKSWTLSFSLKLNTWTSWHSYLPSFYIHTPEKFYSWTHDNTYLWKHNKKGSYQMFYGDLYPHIVEYISISNPLVTRIWNHLRLNTEAKKYDVASDSYYDRRFITFDKMIAYNSRQCTGLVDLLVKDTQPNSQNYLEQQVINYNNNSVLIDKTEKDWFINDLRDIRINYETPIWINNISSLQSEYFIDKILNDSSLDENKDWTQLESFKDKYLVIRLIFNNFVEPSENTKLITNYTVENEQQSFN